MASWDYFPAPPRRSRSRSPGQKYSQRMSSQDYRGEWGDNYDRFGYGRESPTDMRRPRSRSPMGADGSKKRRRSTSPWDRDRYEPRPRYSEDFDAHSRGYGGYSPPRRGGQRGRAPQDPYTLDFPASLKQYADWFRYSFPARAVEEDNADKLAEQEAGDGSKPRNGIKTLWEKYKKEFLTTQLSTMFEHHKKSPWFAEKYDPSPEMQNLRMRVRKEGWKGRLVAFLHDLDSGKFDPNLNEPELEKDTVESKESNAVEELKNAADDEMQFTVDAEEEPIDNDPTKADANGNSKRGRADRERGEEISVPTEGNQIMIRTIPPDIGRLKLHEVCSKIPGFVYLALGDPMQKRNYYRAGWLRFEENADIPSVLSELTETKIEGFKLHVTHNTKPFTSRVRYAPEVASRPERLEKDLTNIIAWANILEEQAATLRHTKVKKDAPVKADGESAEAMDIQEPEDEEEPTEKGTEAVERRVEKIMSELRDQGIIDMNDESAVAAKKTVISLDFYLEYLRAAFHTCYYCAVTTDHVEELQRKCVKHVRRPLSKAMLEDIKAADLEKEKADDNSDLAGEKDERKDVKKDRDWKRNDERWLDWLDSKIALFINRDGIDPHEYGGKVYEEELSKAVEPYIKQEDEGKFRCKYCQKLFKATSFVEKHVANKHPDLVQQLESVVYFNNFALDPHRVQPFTHPPPQSGSGQQLPPQAFGLNPPPGPPGNDYSRMHASDNYSNGGNYHGNYRNAASYGGGYYEGSRQKRLNDRPDKEYDASFGAGLPPKPVSSFETNFTPNRRGGRAGAGGNGPLPPPPPDAKEDPRAAAGRRVSYHDMDLVAEGDVELSY